MNPSELSTADLCVEVEKLTTEQSSALAMAARELAWRVECTLQQDLAGAPDALAFLKVFPE